MPVGQCDVEPGDGQPNLRKKDDRTNMNRPAEEASHAEPPHVAQRGPDRPSSLLDSATMAAH